MLTLAYNEGPKTLRDFMRAGFNQTTAQNALECLEKRELMEREEGPQSNWAERPGNARPYHLTKRGVRLAEEILARKTGKMVVGPWERLDRLTKQMSASPPEIDGFTLPITVCYKGKVVRETLRVWQREPVPELEGVNRFLKTTLNQRQLRQLQMEVKKNTVGFVAEPGANGATVVRTIATLKRPGEELRPLCILRERTPSEGPEDHVEVIGRARVRDPIFALKGIF